MPRGVFLITNGALITVDPALGVLPRADILVRAGRIEQISGAIVPPAGAEVMNATDMIVVPGFVDTHDALAKEHVDAGDFQYRVQHQSPNNVCANSRNARTFAGTLRLAGNTACTGCRGLDQSARTSFNRPAPRCARMAISKGRATPAPPAAASTRPTPSRTITRTGTETASETLPRVNCHSVLGASSGRATMIARWRIRSRGVRGSPHRRR